MLGFFLGAELLSAYSQQTVVVIWNTQIIPINCWVSNSLTFTKYSRGVFVRLCDGKKQSHIPGDFATIQKFFPNSKCIISVTLTAP